MYGDKLYKTLKTTMKHVQNEKNILPNCDRIQLWKQSHNKSKINGNSVRINVICISH